MTPDERSDFMAVARRRAREHAAPTKVSPLTRVIAIGSGKGGVGKSSVSVNLAVALRNAGFRVGLLDADIWGFSVPRMLGSAARLEANDDRKIVPIDVGGIQVVSTGLLVDDEETALMWRGLMLSKALEQFLQDVAWDPKLDYLVLDMPPGTGDIQMALARLLPQAEMVVVTTPQKAAQKVAARVADMARRSYMPVVGVIENMSGFTTPDGRHYDLFGSGGGEDLANDLGVPLIARVPLDPMVVVGRGQRRPGGRRPSRGALGSSDHRGRGPHRRARPPSGGRDVHRADRIAARGARDGGDGRDGLGAWQAGHRPQLQIFTTSGYGFLIPLA